jgi:serine/threonine protein phosphatase 1
MKLTYAIADLHGRFDLLAGAIAAIRADVAQRRRDEILESMTMIFMGDYVDRGPQSAQIITMLKMMSETAKFIKVVCLKGNHEDMMVEVCGDDSFGNLNWWMGNGGRATLVSYGGDASGYPEVSVVPPEHLRWMDRLPIMHVQEHRVFVHAFVDPTLPLDEQPASRVMWELYPPGMFGGHGDRHVVHGHEQFADGPKLYEGRTNLDTWACVTGRLVVGVFDDDLPGGPFDTLEIIGNPAPGWNINGERDDAHFG